MSNVAIVMGYGVPPEMLTDENYRIYLSHVYAGILARNIDSVILCGGSTNICYPEKTEAGEMKRLLDSFSGEKHLNCILVNDTITSWENLKKAFDIIKAFGECQVVVYGEKTRAIKLSLMAQKFGGEKVEVVGIDFDQSRTTYKDIKQLVDIVVTAFQLFVPGINPFRRFYQRRHIKSVSKK